MMMCLNPCFSGSCSWRWQISRQSVLKQLGLNPCFSGSCSWRLTSSFLLVPIHIVLILVLVEVALGGRSGYDVRHQYRYVLILILVEVALGECVRIHLQPLWVAVLILILVEVALGALECLN